jgi:transposase
MRTPTYQVKLSPEERQRLEDLQHEGTHSLREIRRAQVLLLADEGKPNLEIQKLTGLSEPTVIAIKKRYVTEGLILKERPRPGRKPRLDAEQENYLLELAGSEAPAGQDVWTMQQLADRLVQLDVLDSISDETVRRILKKNRLNPGISPAPESSSADLPEVDAEA